MRIYYSFQLRYQGCFYYRCLLPIQFGGWDGDLITLKGQLKSVYQARNAMVNSDLIIFQRPFEKERQNLFIAMKESGKKLVYENDDTYNSEDIVKLGDMAKAVSDSMNWFIKNADLCTTTNEFLANEYRKLNPNVVVLPNCINPQDFPKIQRNKGKKIRIGIIGSVSLDNTGDVNHISDLIKDLSLREDITLVVMGQHPEEGFWKGINIEWHSFVPMVDYYKELANLKLDMAIIPRANSYFCRCKSNVKFLEMSMLEIPCICQTWGDGQSPYDKDGDYCVLANEQDSWRACLNDMVANKEIRKEMGKRAKKYVKEKYDIKKNIHLWKETYNHLLEC